MRRPSVSFVIPMYNEELNIDHAIQAAVEALTKYADDYEIVIVDDASTDASPRIVAERAAENPRIRMIRHEKNRKLGGSLRTGFAAATKDVVLYMDADLPFDPDVLGRALRAMHVTGADVIAGYRHDRTMEGFRRALYSYCYNSLIDAELIVKAKNYGFAIQQIGLDYFPRIRGTSHLSSPSVVFKIIRELIKLYPEMRVRKPRPAPAPAVGTHVRPQEQ